MIVAQQNYHHLHRYTANLQMLCYEAVNILPMIGWMSTVRILILIVIAFLRISCRRVQIDYAAL